MNLSTEKAKELTQNPKFMQELSSVINDEEKCLELFKKYGIEFSKEEYQGLLKSKKQAELLPEDELKNIAGGGLYYVPDSPPRPLTDEEGIALGVTLTVLGIALTTVCTIQKVRK